MCKIAQNSEICCTVLVFRDSTPQKWWCLSYFAVIHCQGSKNGLTIHGSADDRYTTYVDMYTNCTTVAGNLEINALDEKDSYDLHFLESIREVNGYVLIVAVYTDYIPLHNLRIIRGRELLLHDKRYYGLYMMHNGRPDDLSVGIQELRFQSLHGQYFSWK